MIFEDLGLAKIDASKYSPSDLLSLYIKYIELLERKVTCEIENLQRADKSVQTQCDSIYKELNDLKDTITTVKEDLKDIIHRIELNQVSVDIEQTTSIKNIEWRLMMIGGGTSGAVLVITELLKFLIPFIFEHIALK
jgi:hypothetical protein